MLTILDYGAGNQTSVLRALRHLGIDAAITDSPDRLSASEGIIFPGVGSAGQAMDVLTSKGLDSVLARAVREKQPVLGICLGCQILLDRSEEHDTKTLGLVHGETLAFPAGLTQEDGSPAPVPHMGWNSLNVKKPDDPLFRGIPAWPSPSPEVWTAVSCAFQRSGPAPACWPSTRGARTYRSMKPVRPWTSRKTCICRSSSSTPIP